MVAVLVCVEHYLNLKDHFYFIIHFSASPMVLKTLIGVLLFDDNSNIRDSPYSKSRLTKKATLTSFIPEGKFKEYCAISKITHHHVFKVISRLGEALKSNFSMASDW